MEETQHQQKAKEFNKLSYFKPCAYCGKEIGYSGFPICESCWNNKLSEEERKRLKG